LTSLPPVLTKRCNLVNDQLSILVGSTSRCHRFPTLKAITLSHKQQ